MRHAAYSLQISFWDSRKQGTSIEVLLEPTIRCASWIGQSTRVVLVRGGKECGRNEGGPPSLGGSSNHAFPCCFSGLFSLLALSPTLLLCRSDTCTGIQTQNTLCFLGNDLRHRFLWTPPALRRRGYRSVGQQPASRLEPMEFKIYSSKDIVNRHAFILAYVLPNHL